MEFWYDLIGQYGYLSIFAILSIGIIGLPMPDEVLLTYLGYVTSIGEMTFTWTFVFALAGAICGISLSYTLGRVLGEPFLRKFGPKLFIRLKTIDRTNDLFRKYGAFVLIFCYFIPGVRHIAAYIAGITKYSYKRFSLIAYTGAVLWVSTFLIIGNRLGGKWELVTYYVHRYIWIMFVLLLIMVGIVYLYMRNRKIYNKDHSPH